MKEVATMLATPPPAFLAAASAAVPAAAQAVPSDPGFVIYVMAGVLAGTIWRMRYWFTDNGFRRRVFIEDVSSIGALTIGGFGVCDYFELSGWTAGVVAVMSAVVGVDPIRKIAVTLLDTWAKARGQALAGQVVEPPALPPTPPSSPDSGEST